MDQLCCMATKIYSYGGLAGRVLSPIAKSCIFTGFSTPVDDMQLIGMMDSPYVRRVAICLKLLKRDFEHKPISVFSTFEQFKAINPVVKAPTLVLDDGQTLMDSTLILDYLSQDEGATQANRLVPAEPAARLRAFRMTGLALAACEKTVQIAYEYNLRPAEKQHAPWIERVQGQLLAAYGDLEQLVAATTMPTDTAAFGSAEVTIAVAWAFTQMMTPEFVSVDNYPALKAFSDAAGQQPVFLETPAV